MTVCIAVKMLVLLCLFSLAASVPLHFDHLAPYLSYDTPDVISNEYIVVFDSYDRVDEMKVKEHMQLVAKLVQTDNSSRIGRSYNIANRFRGYHAVMSPSVRDLVRARDEVKYVEQNKVVSIAQSECLEQKDPPSWGLARTAFKENPYDNGQYPDYPYNDKMLGAGVDAYIIDTGIDTSHPDFGGRAKWGVDYVDGSEVDGNGHGTHVAGTVVGDTFGLAKGATAIAVRVLDSNGSGSYEAVIAGVDYSVAQFLLGDKKVPSLANMSLGGSISQALLDALEAGAKEGFVVIAAAGNDASDACNTSPAASEFVTTVGATDQTDEFAYFSNYGKCVEIQGPGVSITSTWPNGETSILSGTSMASPHIAGAAAKYMGRFVGGALPTPQEVEDYLVSTATRQAINFPSGERDTPNLLVFMDCSG